ncbi:unnamed protein product [Paramecium sonneborni]|uniref:Transmembrane protein n=1 Tax=Paramecium sonneborni TaxID=65129 RepID=A0A8S1RNY4_9CILI|nr:unnamed protein product [Paramecium sonneborni]
MLSFDSSSRGINLYYKDIINSIDSENKNAAKQLMLQTFTNIEETIKIKERFSEGKLHQLWIDQYWKLINRKSIKKTQVQVIQNMDYIDARFLISSPQFCWLHLCNMKSQIFIINYLGLQINFCYFIQFYDNYMNKFNLCISIEQVDRQYIFVYVQDEYRKCNLGQLQPSHLIKFLPKQKYLVIVVIIGTTIVLKIFLYKKQLERQLFVVQRLQNFSVSKQLQGKLDFDSDDEKIRVIIKMETADFSFQQLTLKEQKDEQSSAYEQLIKSSIMILIKYSKHHNHIVQNSIIYHLISSSFHINQIFELRGQNIRRINEFISVNKKQIRLLAFQTSQKSVEYMQFTCIPTIYTRYFITFSHVQSNISG